VSSYIAAYGAIGGVIVLLLWFYLSGLVIVIGAEMNAEIEHASPWAKAPGEKVPGRKKIGAAAAQAFRERGTALVRRPIAELPPASTTPALATQPTLVERILALVALWIRWRNRTRS
jgi:membrane protein